MLPPGDSYETLCRNFQWSVPETYNIGVDICDKHAHGKDRPALIHIHDKGEITRYTFQQLRNLSNQLANALKAYGMRRGDRVGILLPQCAETAISHIATYKLGGIALPLFTLFGSEALSYRLSDSGARWLVTNEENFEKVLSIKETVSDLKTVFVVGGHLRDGAVDFWEAVGKASDIFTPVSTRAEDPALIIYTSGTTGPPKGALHAHRVLLGHLPGVEFPHNFFPKPGDCFWTPADWAWIGGLIDVLLPAWHHGIPVVAHRAKKFDPEQAFDLMSRHGIRNAFIPPTALKLMRQVKDPQKRYALNVRSIGSGGETLGEELLEWGKSVFGLTLNEFYGQTEANLIVANCSEIMPVRPGSMGKAVPGHRIEIVDDQGESLSVGQVGNIAVRRPDPVMFLEYWNNKKATQKKFIGDWCLTGDMGKKDEDGYFWFVGREDDLITSAGYRIGPGEIEDCLLKHPAVAMAAVVGVPDPIRTQIVKAFIVIKPDHEPDMTLKNDLQGFVRSRLAAHEYPREIEFVRELPMTATGKIIRKRLREQEDQERGGRQ